MKKYGFTIVLFSTLIAFSSSIFSKEPINLYITKQKLIAYHESGAYQNDIATTVKKAARYVKKRVADNHASSHPKKLAAVFDIDETCLSNYPDLAKMDFGGTDDALNHAEDAAHDKPIKPVLGLYHLLRKNHVAIFFVTGRLPYQRQATIDNLKSAGFTHWEALYLKPNHYTFKSAIPYKSSVRKKIEKMGYDIILTMGDQWSDLKGGYADKGFKLSDPFYFIS